jgi:hypothetical protein
LDRDLVYQSNIAVLFLKTGLTHREAVRHEIYMIAVLGRKDKGEGVPGK